MPLVSLGWQRLDDNVQITTIISTSYRPLTKFLSKYSRKQNTGDFAIFFIFIFFLIIWDLWVEKTSNRSMHQIIYILVTWIQNKHSNIMSINAKHAAALQIRSSKRSPLRFEACKFLIQRCAKWINYGYFTALLQNGDGLEYKGHLLT